MTRHYRNLITALDAIPDDQVEGVMLRAWHYVLRARLRSVCSEAKNSANASRSSSDSDATQTGQSARVFGGPPEE
jgi:hypothetical protein